MGSPPIAKFVPNVGAPSSLDLSQDDSLMLYVANAAGVMTYDGEMWNLIPLPNGDAVTALRKDAGTRVYVGGHDVFGYMEHDETGLPRFHDLTEVFRSQIGSESFGGIYLIRVTKDGVFFEGTKVVFMYSPTTNTGRMWKHEGRLGAMEDVRGDLWLQFRGEGLRRFRDGEWQPIAGTEGMNLLTNALLPMPDGGVLGMSADGQWREFINGHVVNFKMPKGFPNSSEFNAARVLRDGTFALAGISGALWLYNPANGDFRSMQISQGPIIEMRVAADGGLIALTDLAVYHVGWPNDWTSVGLESGVSGAVHRIRPWGDRWMALTNNGVYSTVAAPANAAVQFKRLKYTDYDGYDLMPVDQHHAYLAENFKLFWVDDTKVLKSIGRADLYPRLLMRSQSHPDQIYVGTDLGIALLDANATGGSFRIDRGSREETVTDLVELSATELLMGTERDGVRLVTFDEDRRRVVEDRLLDQTDGIRYGQIAHASISRLSDGRIVASTTAGLFAYANHKFTPVNFDGLKLPSEPTPVLRFAFGPTGDWAYGAQAVYHRIDASTWRSEEVAPIVSGYIESIAFDGDHVTLFGCANTIMRNDADAVRVTSAPPTIQLRTVEEIGPDSEGQRFALVPADEMKVPDDFSISFHFALPEMSGKETALYQARLKGRDPSFSNFQAGTTYRYRHLPPGEYTFQAAARDRLGRISETKPFFFVVEAPWYATLSAKILWALLVLVGIGLVVYVAISWRTRVLTRQRIALELEVSERTQDLVHANDRLNDLAHRDTLTGLANRALFESRLQQACARAQRHAGRFAVLFVDLDQFKTINDSLGHEAGDRLLQEVSARLLTRLRVEDTLARWGGDEFMVLVEELDTAEDVTSVAQALLEAASAPIKLANSAIAALSTSVGVSIYPDDSTNVYELIRNADTAMYSAKQRGGNQWCFYASEMTVVARERLEVLNGLRVAVDQGDFVLHYQPIADLATGQVMGVEALIRWRREGDHLVLPETFISVAESTDLISIIGAWVIRTACREARAWLASDPDFSLALNISPRQLRTSELVRIVETALAEEHINPRQLTLEVTESSIAAVGESAKIIIQELKQLGVRVALDDFGTGQSALSSLKRFDFDILKIDRSFIRDTPMDHDDMEIAATIVAMGHTLGLVVIAEGVETEDQLDFLRSCGCDRYQGFHLSQALPAHQLSEMFAPARDQVDA